MNSLVKKQYINKKAKFNAIFFPGFPGEYKDRPLMEDLKKLNFNIYSIVYPGTYGSRGIFSPRSVDKLVKNITTSFNKLNKPVLLVTYSFSTYIILSEIPKFKRLMGILLFSPILDLHQSIKPNFVKDLQEIGKSDGFKIDVSSWKRYITEKDNTYQETYKSWLKNNQNNIPLIFVIGGKDPVIKRQVVNKFLDGYTEGINCNTLMKIEVPKGVHKLDSLYEDKTIYKLLVAITISFKLANKYPNMNFYLWGSTLNYRYSNLDSDIDMILVGDSFSFDDYVYINRFGIQYEKDYGIAMNLSPITYKELDSEERIRSNRGPTFIHEIKYYYLPLKISRKISLRNFSGEVLKNDAIFANDSNIYKSKKGIAHATSEAKAFKYVIKHFLFGAIFYQYTKNNLYPNQNFIEQYYKLSNPYVYKILNKIRKMKSGTGSFPISFVRKVLNLHEELFQQ